MNYRTLLYLFFPISMVSCSVGPSYVTPSITVPTNWKNKQETACQEPEVNEQGELCYLDHWWEVFNDSKLVELEVLAAENNRNLFIAFERIQEAQALRKIAAADFYPHLTLNPLSTNTMELVKNYLNPNATNNKRLSNTTTGIPFRSHQMLYSLPINFSYEVDLWGKIREKYRSTTYDWLAQKKDYEAVMLSLTANLAIAYYQLRAADAQIDLLQETLQTREKALEINQARYDEQITFYADVTLAAEEVEIVKGQYDEILRQRKLLENLIAVLIGMPASEFCIEHIPLQELPPCIPEGIPSEMLLRRPDIAEAEYRTRSEHALVKSAYSQFFPSLILTATGGFQSPILKSFLSTMSRFWMDSPQINQLIFDGGATYYQVQLQIELFRQAGASYQQQVLVAFQETENALGNIDSYAKQYEIALRTSHWAQKTYQLYLDRYSLGVIYYIDVANTERDWLNYQVDVNSLLGFRYIATIQLIQALGGGW